MRGGSGGREQGIGVQVEVRVGVGVEVGVGDGGRTGGEWRKWEEAPAICPRVDPAGVQRTAA